MAEEKKKKKKEKSGVGVHCVEGPMTSGLYCAIFPFCGRGKKKKRKKKKGDKKTKAFYDWATTGIPVIV